MPFAHLNNHTIHYTDIPPDPSTPSTTTTASKTLLFIHGLGSTQNYFLPLTPHLSQHRLIIFDNYGAGRSSYTHNTETSIPLIARDALSLLDHLSIPQAIAIGYSMGGMLPTYLAASSPSRITGAICIGPVHPSASVSAVFAQRIPTVRAGGMESMANTIPSSATGERATALQKAFIREMLLSQDPAGYIANCRAIETAEPPVYADVKVPVLIIAGRQDKSAPLPACEYILSQLGSDCRRKRLEVLDGVGHWHCVEAPDEVGALVAGFVGELDR